MAGSSSVMWVIFDGCVVCWYPQERGAGGGRLPGRAVWGIWLVCGIFDDSPVSPRNVVLAAAEFRAGPRRSDRKGSSSQLGGGDPAASYQSLGQALLGTVL